MGILEEAGHPVMKSEYTYDMMIKHVKNNDPYHMLGTPHNDLHGISMMVTHCKFLALLASIIEMDKKLAAQEAPNTSSSVAPTAIAIREDLPLAESMVAICPTCKDKDKARVRPLATTRAVNLP